MSWLSVCIEIDSPSTELLGDCLLAAGALSVSLEDADAGTPAETPQFGEPGALLQPEWAHSRLLALFDKNADVPAILAHCARELAWREVPPYQVSEVAEQNWVQLTQAQFEPIRISERLWIVPSWHEAPDPDALVLVLDPGMAFGTGSHPTTRLCLEWLESEVRSGVSVLDYGCGSGILAIAAARLGAGRVEGIDIDEQAVNAARANAERNGVAITFYDSSSALSKDYDVVVANILSNPLKVLAPALCALVAPGGLLALSGILVEQSEDLIAIYAPYIRLKLVQQRDGWVCLGGRKDSAA